jgi:hypothetical protein
LIAQSAAPDQRDDLDSIARLESANGVLCARDQVAVALDSHESRLHLQLGEERSHRGAGRELLGFSVDEYLDHGQPQAFTRIGPSFATLQRDRERSACQRRPPHLILA